MMLHRGPRKTHVRGLTYVMPNQSNHCRGPYYCRVIHACRFIMAGECASVAVRLAFQLAGRRRRDEVWNGANVD
jgi:hypothetical protein